MFGAVISTKKLKVGLVGAGVQGQRHARILSELSSAEFVGVADLDEKRAKETAAAYGTEYYTDASKLIGKADAVSIVVPSIFHRKSAVPFLEKGVHCLIEKPITVDLKEADDIISAAKKGKAKVMVGHVERFNPAVRELRKILEGEKIIQIEARRYGPFMGRATDAGVILDLMIHDIDVIRYITGSEPNEIYSMGGKIKTDKEDFATSVMRLRNGTVAFLSTSRVTQKKVRDLYIMCEDMFIEADYLEQSVNIYRRSMPSFAVKGGEAVYKQENVIEKVDVFKQEPLKNEIQCFVDCILNGKEPEINAEEGKKNLEIALKITGELR